jgi:hypothetical protein
MIERIKAFWEGLFTREVPSVPVPPVIEEPVDRYLNLLERASEAKPILVESTVVCQFCDKEEPMNLLDFLTHCYVDHNMTRLEGEKLFYNLLKRLRKKNGLE